MPQLKAIFVALIVTELKDLTMNGKRLFRSRLFNDIDNVL